MGFIILVLSMCLCGFEFSTQVIAKGYHSSLIRIWLFRHSFRCHLILLEFHLICRYVMMFIVENSITWQVNTRALFHICHRHTHK